jgi:hypothetical protein
LQLQPGERAIFAYFNDDHDARTAAEALIQSGYSDIQVDRISPYVNSTVNRSIKTSLSSLTMNHGAGLSYGPLLAADPAVSGMSSSFASPSPSVVLTLVCDDTTKAQAIELLRQYGASI